MLLILFGWNLQKAINTSEKSCFSLKPFMNTNKLDKMVILLGEEKANVQGVPFVKAESSCVKLSQADSS